MVDLSELSTNPALISIQGLNPVSVARTEALGTSFDFTPAVPTTKRLVDFFKLIPAELVQDLPEPHQRQVEAHANTVWTTVQNMLGFNPNQNNAATERQSLIDQLNSQYSDAFSSLGSIAAYFSALPAGRNRSEEELAQLLEAARQSSGEMEKIRETVKGEADRMLTEVRKVSAEAGVSQQATYFGNQATTDGVTAERWQLRTNLLALLLVAFAVLTWVMSYSWVPTNVFQAAQLVVSKVLIVSTVGYLLFLSGRTLMAHRHNEVVNRHRQNALLTFNALADAAPSDQTREVVLTHASACIYAPQDTGFTKGGSQSPSSLIELAPRILSASHPTGA